MGTMTGNEKKELIAQAKRLFTDGLKITALENKIKRYVQKGYSLDSDEIVKTYKKLISAQTAWDKLEKEHLTFRQSLEERTQNVCVTDNTRKDS